MSQVQADVPLQVLASDDVTIQSNLNTAVLHVTYVGIVAGVTIAGGQAELEEHIAGLAPEVLHGTVQAALEELEVNTHVEVATLLPCNILVTHT